MTHTLICSQSLLLVRDVGDEEETQNEEKDDVFHKKRSKILSRIILVI